tara:strand:+ start:730 stop:1338 length:609 start_codon:yes stop_codon:yes gene_type:complete
MPKWSILVSTTPKRFDNCFLEIISHLEKLVSDRPIEVLGLFDNYYTGTGSKRNSIIKAAAGDYISFVDDDDWVDDLYVEKIWEALSQNPGVDSVYFNTLVKKPDGSSQEVRYDHALQQDHKFAYDSQGGSQSVLRVPFTAVWKSSIMREVPFENGRSQDITWSRQANRKISKFVYIEDPLYIYNYDIRESEAKDLEEKFGLY